MGKCVPLRPITLNQWRRFTHSFTFRFGVLKEKEVRKNLKNSLGKRHSPWLLVNSNNNNNNEEIDCKLCERIRHVGDASRH